MNKNDKSYNLSEKDKLRLEIKKENPFKPGNSESSVNTSRESEKLAEIKVLNKEFIKPGGRRRSRIIIDDNLLTF